MTFRDLYRWSPPLAITGWIHAVLLVAALVLLPLDSRQVLGISPWIKPIKFNASIILYVWAMAWYVGQLVDRPLLRKLAWTISIAMLAETACIQLQAIRGTTSHFNNATPFDGIVFGVMGMFIAINTVAAAWIAVLYFRETPALTPAVLLGARLGLVLFLIGTVEGGMMIANKAHTVGGPDGGPGLPFLTWSTKFGDLRWAHFIGMHGLQGLPLVGWLVGNKKLVAGAFAAGLAAVLVALVIALQGRPMIAL